MGDLKFIFHFSKLFFIFLFFSLSINAEENRIFNLPEVFVTNTRTNIGLPGSSTKVYSQDYISNSTATNLAELMGNIAGIQYRDMFGGSGQIGRHLIRRLTKKNHLVTVVTRNLHKKGIILKTQGNPGYIEVVEANIFKEDQLNHLFENKDICINLVGILFEKKKQYF